MGASKAQSLLMLQRQSAEVQSALQQAHQKVQSLEEQLADFLQGYYAAIGEEFAALEQLQAQLAEAQRTALGLHPVPASSVPLPCSELNSDHRKNSADELNALYRDLARFCHPDHAATCSDNEGKETLMKTLNAARAEQNLGELWRVKWKVEQQKNGGALTHQQRLALLEAQQQHMQTHLEALQQKEAELRTSAAFRLMQHAQIMRISGQDFIGSVKARLARQIEEARQQLRHTRYQQRYWQQVKLG